MIGAVRRRLGGGSLNARVARSSLLTLGGYGGAQFIRLVSNLILTRLLFPDAFGLMALVLVFIVGLAQFSDVGVTPAILQSKRGDDQKFLDTAWTIQVVRGVLLWAVACLIAFPVAWFYDEPMLAQLLPVAAASLAISGFRPTRMDTANRHLLIGRVTAINLVVQVIGVGSGVILAWITGSVWALVASNLIGALADVVLNSAFLPGVRNRLQVERAAFSELINFGKWVFLSTVCGFIYQQADKLLIGRYLPIDVLGVYNIGASLATMTWMLGAMMATRLLIPIYRESPPSESRANFIKLRKIRSILTMGLMAMASILAYSGVALVDVMYDPRYSMAGAVVVMIACAHMPLLIAMTYDQAALAVGDSRSFFVLALARAALTAGFLWVGLVFGGLFGALLGLIAAAALIYPFVVWLARKAQAWDPLHDLVFAVLGAVIASTAIWQNWEAVTALMAPGS